MLLTKFVEFGGNSIVFGTVVLNNDEFDKVMLKSVEYTGIGSWYNMPEKWIRRV